ncbi:MAG: Malonyl CoA-acyl carrier protein transacylase [Polyangiaceae bacterium]|nr:Malonyl CoA-acyl carrier protein transacylase [Polyangiaceae bacterium]
MFAAERSTQRTDAIPEASRNERLPASFAQQRLWFLDQFEQGAVTYHIPLMLRIRGAVNEAALKRAVEALVDRHESLRTHLESDANGLRQVIAPPGGFAVRVGDTGDSALQLAACLAEAAEPFDLAKGPLFRARLLRASDEERVLQLTVHHVVSDGWSMSLMLRELEQLYVAFANGKANPLPPLRVQYADFVRWHGPWLNEGSLAADLQYWREQLAGLEPLLLRPDRPRPALKTYRGAHHSFHLPVELSRRLKEVGDQQGATLFITLLSVFYALLYRYTGQTDIAVGTTSANRGVPETQAMVGLFVNTLVLRAEIGPTQPFSELLRRVREIALDAYSHQDVPFERLVEELRPTRSMSHGPLFEIMFMLQNLPPRGDVIPGCDVEVADLSLGTSKFDLNLSLRDSPAGLFGTVEYNTDLFDAATVERLVGHYENLLRSVAADPNQQVAELALIGERERSTLLVDWNATERSYDREACIHELFEARAALQPTAIALSDGRREVTYRQLNRAANRLARRLSSRGVKPGVRVAVCMQRTCELVVALLAVLKAGGAYVPVDPGYPAARIGWILEDSGAELAITEAALSESVSAVGTRILASADWFDDDLSASADAEDVDRASCGLVSEHVAYIIYTSGSTGRPKGVVVQHRPVINVIDWVNRTFGVAPTDKLLFVTSVSFDLSVYDLFGALAAGAHIRLASSALLKAPDELARVLSTEQITIWDSAPAQLQQLVPFMEPPSLNASCGWLRLVLLSGDWIPVGLPDAVRSCFPSASIISLGGATEATVWSNYFPIEKVEPSWTSIPYGKPIQNAKYYVLDSAGMPCPIGIAGHLYIAGECLAFGYNNDAALNARKFVDSRFAPGTRLYATGDLSRWMPDGNLEFLGRDDGQVKVRGFRIELGEVERAMLVHSKVSEAVVLVQADDRGERFLCAHYVGSVEPAALKAHLGGLLPDYMLPSFIAKLDALPMTANGKLDRKGLLGVDALRTRLGAKYTPPGSELGAELAQLVGEALGVERVGLHDNFFDLGGTSLNLTRLNKSINERYTKKMSLVELFRTPTVGGIAAFLSGKQDAAQDLAREDEDAFERSLSIFEQ